MKRFGKQILVVITDGHKFGNVLTVSAIEKDEMMMLPLLGVDEEEEEKDN